MIRLDCDLILHLWLEERAVRWALKPSTELCASSQFERVGSPPVVLDWINTIGPREMDRSSLVETRRGARFKDLFVSDHGLHLYLEDRLVLNFGMAQRISDAEFVIHAFEDV